MKSFAYVTVFGFFFKSNHWGSHIPSSWMVQAGYVLDAGIHPAFMTVESARWNACVHRLDLGLYSHPKEFGGNGVRTHVNSKGKIPSTGKKILLKGGSSPRRCIKQDSEPNTLPTSYSGPSIASLICKSTHGVAAHTTDPGHP